VIYDAAVVGAGILGLAHAWSLAKRGLRVLVLERHARAQGASVRNFGMIWPIGQPSGPLYDLARRSRELWLEVLRASNLWHAQAGSLHLAYHDDEAEVLREFTAEAARVGRPGELWTARQIGARFPAVCQQNLRAGLWSADEVTVDPRQVLAALPRWLQERHGVDVVYGAAVLGCDGQRLLTTQGEWSTRRLVICTGADFRELAPAAFADSGLVPCKLQMMRSQPYGPRFRVGTMLAAGLTLRHYPTFANCPTLPALVRRLDAVLPEYGRFGIHVLIAQNEQGELVLGDSHEYGDAIEPFDKAEIDDLVLAYLRTFVTIPDLQIAARWHGVYVKHPTKPYVAVEPWPNALAVTGVGGAGMTLSFGLAEKLTADWLGHGLETDMIELVVFDMAGTTVRDSGAVNDCFRAALAAAGCKVEPGAVNGAMGLSKPQALRQLLTEAGRPAGDDVVARIHGDFVARMQQHYASDPSVGEIPGATATFETLRRAGIKVALNTGFSRPIVDLLLQRLGWKPGATIDAVVTSDEVPRGRPDPDMIHLLMERLGISDARRVAKVGDTCIDLEEGHRAGCGLVIGVSSGTCTRAQLEAIPHSQVVASIVDVPELVLAQQAAHTD
jgi:FAD dependent oxidoreductase TIGR03364/phosphonatase-like hydrolase